MNKNIKKLTIILFFIILGCGYKPIFKNDYQFSINALNLKGDDVVNSIISEKFQLLTTINKKLNYDLNVETELNKNIISKDSKGDPLIFEILIKADIEIIKQDKKLLGRNIQKRNTYNNISDKFELEKFEDILIKNLSTNISMDIISIVSNFANDN